MYRVRFGESARVCTPCLRYALGLIDHPPTGNLRANATSAAHDTLARSLAEQSAVLLKVRTALAAQKTVSLILPRPAFQNDGATLPLNASRLRSLLILGDNDTVTCGGSGHVNAEYIVSPYAGIAAYIAAHAPGVRLLYNSGLNATSAAALAAASDAAIVVVATTSSEGSDRVNLSLPLWQDELVAAVAAVQPVTVAVARCPGACVMPWSGATAAIIFQLMAGQVRGGTVCGRIRLH